MKINKTYLLCILISIFVGIIICSSYLGSGKEGFTIDGLEDDIDSDATDVSDDINSTINNITGAPQTGTAPVPTYSTNGNTTSTSTSTSESASNSSNTDIAKLISGTNTYDNYNYYTKSSSPTTYYGPNGANARVINKNGTYAIIVTDANGNVSDYTINSSGNKPDPNPPNNLPDNSIIIIDNKVLELVFECNNNGASAKIYKGPKGNITIVVKYPNGEVKIFSEINMQTHTGNIEEAGVAIQKYQDMNTSPNMNTNTSGLYDSSLPPGVSKRMIPHGEDDKYILKSQIVPPVCPACPTITGCPSNKNTSPDSNSGSSSGSSSGTGSGPTPQSGSGYDYQPIPVLSDFSMFGQ